MARAPKQPLEQDADVGVVVDDENLRGVHTIFLPKRHPDHFRLQISIGMMARILIVEPHPEVRDLLVRIVQRLGHECVRLGDGDLGDAAADVAVLEPSDKDALELGRELHVRGVPLVCVSIEPQSPETYALEPAAYVLKPFALHELEAAIKAALEQTKGSPACPRA